MIIEDLKGHFNQKIIEYELRLQKHNPEFKLSEFEKLNIMEAFEYGYELAKTNKTKSYVCTQCGKIKFGDNGCDMDKYEQKE